MPTWNIDFNMRLQTNTSEVVSRIAMIHAFASVVRSIPIPPMVQDSLDRLNILRAVRGTTGIEGAELTDDEVNRIMGSPPGEFVLPASRRREEQEAQNANRLMYYVAELIIREPDLPLTEDLIRRIHEVLTNGIDYPTNVPGVYREHPVQAGAYVPPRTGDEVRDCMGRFIRWFNEGVSTTWDPVVRAIAAHFYIVSIHPFGEGNGRTSRGVESLLLYQAGINARGFYSLANYYYRNRAEYIRLLDHVRFETQGDLTPFVLFALRGLEEELRAVHEEVLAEVRLIAFRDFARETLRSRLGTPPGERMLSFLLSLGREPVSLKTLRRGEHQLYRFYRDVTQKTLSRDLGFLRQHDLVLVVGDELRANLDLMTQFTPPHDHMRPNRRQRGPDTTTAP